MEAGQPGRNTRAMATAVFDRAEIKTAFLLRKIEQMVIAAYLSVSSVLLLSVAAAVLWKPEIAVGARSVAIPRSGRHAGPHA